VYHSDVSGVDSGVHMGKLITELSVTGVNCVSDSDLVCDTSCIIELSSSSVDDKCVLTVDDAACVDDGGVDNVHNLSCGSEVLSQTPSVIHDIDIDNIALGSICDGDCLLCDLSTKIQGVLGADSIKWLVWAHDQIVASGRHNYECCRFVVPSKLNIEFFRAMLWDYSDRLVCDLLEFGFPLGFDGVDLELSQKSPKNHSGARNFPVAMGKYLEKEASYAAVIGPFNVSPFCTPITLSPLNTVPKGVDERRVILDLSFPHGRAVNDGIQKDWYLGERVTLTFPNVDDMVDIIKAKGQGCLLYKRDLKRAYRQIPVDPGNIHLVGFSWEGHIFVDRVLSMGLRSAAHICQRVTTAVTFMHVKNGFALVNYLDDFAGGEKVDAAVVAFEQLGQLLEACGLEESVEKALVPCTRMVFIGVLHDTVTLTLEVTPERLCEISLLVQAWLRKRKCSLKDLQSLLGKLHFVAACVRPGRIFVCRLLTFLRTFSPDAGLLCIPVYVKKDLLWWSEFLPLYNGVSMMAIEEWSSPDGVFACDACLDGCGGMFEGQYFHALFPCFVREQGLDINCLELLTICVCLRVWRADLCGKRITVKCDNNTSVIVLNSGASRHPFLQSCLREICFLAAIHQFEIRGVHIEGSKNRVPDLLSRWFQYPKARVEFAEATRDLDCREVLVEASMFSFSHNW
jgi:hypothetical protein